MTHQYYWGQEVVVGAARHRGASLIQAGYPALARIERSCSACSSRWRMNIRSATAETVISPRSGECPGVPAGPPSSAQPRGRGPRAPLATWSNSSPTGRTRSRPIAAIRSSFVATLPNGTGSDTPRGSARSGPSSRWRSRPRARGSGGFHVFRFVPEVVAGGPRRASLTAGAQGVEPPVGHDQPVRDVVGHGHEFPTFRRSMKPRQRLGPIPRGQAGGGHPAASSSDDRHDRPGRRQPGGRPAQRPDAYAEAQDFLPLKGIDHVEFWVGNARQASAYYRALWGFTPVAFQRTRDEGPRPGRASWSRTTSDSCSRPR